MARAMENLPVDDPEQLAKARPWRQRAWDRVPGWARIGLGALLIGLLVNVALVIRIWYGLQDPPEVAAIRAPGRHIIMPETNHNIRTPDDLLDAIPAGLRGVSSKDVTAVRLEQQATDELVAHIAQHFPGVQSLYFAGGNITSKGLLALKSCPEITSLDVADTDLDDGLGDLLPHLPKLNSLLARNTNLTDAFTQAAAKHDLLAYTVIEGTDITQDAIDAWQSARPKTRIQADFDRVALRGRIRWSDGETNRRFSGAYEVGRYGPRRTDGSGAWSASFSSKSTGLFGDLLRWSKSEFKDMQDGEYQIRLKLGGIEATPADFIVKDGVPIPDRIELRMPVTRAEAERLTGAGGKK
jgi:hypothetical protein